MILNLGYDSFFEEKKKESGWSEFQVARVIVENKERYIVISDSGESEAQIIGKMRYTANSRLDFPGVGDWVVISEIEKGQAIIHGILERKTTLIRKSVDRENLQLIGANIDFAFIVSSVDRDFNPNRIARYLTLSNTGGVKPIIVLTKIDLIESIKILEYTDILNYQFPDIPILKISTFHEIGINELESLLEQGKTYCFLGSSGVGKSTIINRLLGNLYFSTQELSQSTKKGKHTTTHRELILLNNGAILMDTPGMREVGLTSTHTGLEETYSEISYLAQNCKFKDCTHTNEMHCAVLKAIEENQLDGKMLENYRKLEKERLFHEISEIEKRQKDKKFGKMVKEALSFKQSQKKRKSD